MDELRALSQRLQARNTGGRPSDSVIYGLGPRKTPRADDADDADADDADDVVAVAVEQAQPFG
jgi:hypothetical protein